MRVNICQNHLCRREYRKKRFKTHMYISGYRVNDENVRLDNN